MKYIISFMILISLISVIVSSFNCYNTCNKDNKENYKDSIYKGYYSQDSVNNCIVNGNCQNFDCQQGDNGCFCLYKCPNFPVPFSFDCSRGIDFMSLNETCSKVGGGTAMPL